jgi:hypothetical protein
VGVALVYPFSLLGDKDNSISAFQWPTLATKRAA